MLVRLNIVTADVS